MKKFNKFYFKKYEFDKVSLEAKFYYSFDEEEFFEETIYFGDNSFEINSGVDFNKIDIFLFNIHMALGISYYKLYPTKNLVVESGYLDNDDISFWKKFYINGLGEFLYKNKIDPSQLFNFIIDKKLEKNICVLPKTGDKIILPIGGGKDSLVSMSILDENKLESDLFVFGKSDFIKDKCISKSGKNHLLVKRKLSPNLFDLNAKGYFNGHVPISGIIAFNLLLASYLYGYKYIVMSNEESASEENILWKGLKINHQYSKSLAFEIDFRDYVSKNISKDIKYFSLLSGMSEYKIAEIFSEKSQKYFSDFSSCNNNFKILLDNKSCTNDSLWCQKCEKCCFVFLILSNFLEINELENIFGSNLFKNNLLLDTFVGLIGYSENKPFECVGTYEESLFSTVQAIEKFKNNKFFVIDSLDDLLKDESFDFDLKKVKEKLLNISTEDIIPAEFKNKIKELNINV